MGSHPSRCQNIERRHIPENPEYDNYRRRYRRCFLRYTDRSEFHPWEHDPQVFVREHKQAWNPKDRKQDIVRNRLRKAAMEQRADCPA